MKKTETIDGQEITVATITIGALESIEIAGKTGRKFNIAFIACALLAAGDTDHGTEAWVYSLQAFDPDGVKSDFDKLLEATNLVNGFKPKPKQLGEGEPAAPAA